MVFQAETKEKLTFIMTVIEKQVNHWFDQWTH